MKMDSYTSTRNNSSRGVYDSTRVRGRPPWASRAQLFSGDILISLMVFLLVLSLISVIWSESNLQLREFKARSSLVVDAGLAGDILMHTRGTPIDWTDDDVVSIGVSDGKQINPAKFLELTTVDYDLSRSLLGLGNYDYLISITNGSAPVSSGVLLDRIAYFGAGDSAILEDLNSSGTKWDFYDASIAGSGFTQTEYYSGTQSFLSSALFSNISNYSTLVFEDVNVTLNYSLLLQFLDDGGVIVFEGNGNEASSPAEPFLTMEKENSVSAFVSDKSFLVFNSSVGDQVDFVGDQWSVSSRFNSVISDSVSNNSYAGYSRVRNGVVYFVSDYSMTSLNRNASQFFNLVGTPMSFGVDEFGVKDVFILKRPALIGVEKKKLAVFELVVSEK